MKKRAVDLRRAVGLGVLSTMLVAAAYITTMLILAGLGKVQPARERSDCVLMLLQCLLGIAGVCLPALLEKRHNFVIPSYMMILYVCAWYMSPLMWDLQELC